MFIKIRITDASDYFSRYNLTILGTYSVTYQSLTYQPVVNRHEFKRGVRPLIKIDFSNSDDPKMVAYDYDD